nr:MAG TPA: hypothetical protein [Inoviridae sp.]
MKVFVKILSVILIISLISPVVINAADVNVRPVNPVKSSYDDNNIYFEYNGKSYTVPRNTKISMYNDYYAYCIYDTSTNGEQFDFLRVAKDNIKEVSYYHTNMKRSRYSRLPMTYEKTAWNDFVSVSYWYSPSSNKVYVLSGCYVYGIGNKGAEVLSYSNSFNDNNSKFKLTNGGYYDSSFEGYYGVVVCSIFDLGTGTSISSVAYCYTTKYLTLTSLDFVDSSKLDKPVGTSSSLDIYHLSKSTYKEYFPADLLCLYANYKIDGFYDNSNISEVKTPSYYFAYQYLYQTKEGFYFVDSSKRLTSLTYDNGASAIFTFDGECNKRIYRSVDGQTWFNMTEINNMYGKIISCSYEYLYDSSGQPIYKMIYTNDDMIGMSDKPVYDDYFNKHDFFTTFPTWREEYKEGLVWDSYKDYISASEGKEKLNWIGQFGMTALDAINSAIKSMPFGGGFDASSYYNDLFLGTSLSAADAGILNIFSNLTMEFNYQYDSSGNLVSRTRTIYGYLKMLANNGYDTVQYLSSMQDEITKPLFDAISYQSDILISFKDSNISKLKDIRSSISSLIEWVDLGNTYQLRTLNYLKDTLPSLAFDDSSVIAAIKDISLSGSGGTFNFDDSAILSRLDSIRDRMDYTYKPVLKDYDDDPDDDNTSVVDFISNGISSASVIQPIALSPGVLAAITTVNSWITNIWDNLGKVQTVVILGLTFMVVDVALRREGSVD